jgi:hypothetical protein
MMPAMASFTPRLENRAVSRGPPPATAPAASERHTCCPLQEEPRLQLVDVPLARPSREEAHRDTQLGVHRCCDPLATMGVLQDRARARCPIGQQRTVLGVRRPSGHRA